MRKFSRLQIFVKVETPISFPTTANPPYAIVYFSENSSFVDDLSKLQLRKSELRYVWIPPTKIPRTFLSTDIRQIYQSIHMQVFSRLQNIPQNKNIIIDLSYYLKAIDRKKPQSYRNHYGTLIVSLLQKIISLVQKQYQTVLCYSIDQTKDFSKSFINRKIFPPLQSIKKKEIVIPNFLLAKIDESGASYRLLIKDKETNFQKMLYFLKNIEPVKAKQTTKEPAPINIVSDKIVNKIVSHLKVSDNDKTKLQKLVKNLLEKNPELYKELQPITSINKDISDRIASVAIVYQVTGNIKKSLAQVDKIKEKRQSFEKVIKIYFDQVIVPEKPKILTSDTLVKISSPAKINDNLSASYVFQKRNLDFHETLEKDIKESFKIFEKKENPLKLKSFTIEKKTKDPEDLSRTELSYINAVLVDENKNEHKIRIAIPYLNPKDGSFLINGKRNVLLNQIIPCPISFPKPHESRFESSYSIFRIYSKKLRSLSYFEIFIAATSLPLFVPLCYMFSYDEVLSQYKIKATIFHKKTRSISEEELCVKVSNDTWVLFENLQNEVQKQLCNSFKKAKPDKYSISSTFPSNEYFQELIYKMTKRASVPYVMRNMRDNIVTNITKEVLISKQLPYKLKNIIQYMATRVTTDYYEERNDISNQRVRSSEVVAHLVQKELLGAYTAYSEQKLSGNKNPRFEVAEQRVIQNFNKLQITTMMEFANPIEELTSITRITPIGMGVGGLASKDAVQMQARNIHRTYYGNIDPLDTPEGAGIGVVQQLTVGALLTNKRGIFQTQKFTKDNPAKLLSPSACMVPFIEHNEGARIIMSTNQIKQAVPLKHVTKPIVQSGFESVFVENVSDNFVRKSPCDGRVINIDENEIKIECSEGKKKTVSLAPVTLSSGSGLASLSVFRPTVKLNSKIKKDQVLANGACVSDNIISLGTNLCTAYMPYKGYNYEDAIVISEDVLEKELLTSFSSVTVEVTISKNDKIIMFDPTYRDTKKGEPLLKRVSGSVVDLIGWIDTDQDVLLSGEIVTQSPGGKIINIEIFSNVDDKVFPQFKEIVRRTDRNHNKRPNKKYKVKGEVIKDVLIKFTIQQERHIEIGDKLCNRYGNKGVIALIEKTEKMPICPTGDKIQIIMNPLGVLNRMNVGQLYEIYLGLASKEIYRRFIKNSQSDNYNMLSQLIPLVDNTQNKIYSTNFLNSFKKLSKKQYKMVQEQIEKDQFFPFIIPPFKSPQINNIKKLLSLLNLKMSYKLKLPEFNTKTYSAVPVGYIYYYKLEHISDKKVAARSTGPVEQKTLQPLAGAKKSGGQRLGENDTYALLSYDCKKTLSELMGPLSDDVAGKNELISNIINKGSTHFVKPKQNPTRDLIAMYAKAMMIEL